MPQAKAGRAPSDEEADEVYARIMNEAAAYALVISAGGGVACIATPRAQRMAGVRNQVLRMGLFELEPGEEEPDA
jgi:hypothetical protein